LIVALFFVTQIFTTMTEPHEVVIDQALIFLVPDFTPLQVAELEETPASLYLKVNLHFTVVPLTFFVFQPVVSEH